MLKHHFLDALRALGESAGRVGQLENHIFDLAPFGILWLGLAHDSRKRIKPSARQPKLAIEGLRGSLPTNHAGAWTLRPLRKRSDLPSQIARTPSNFSLTR